MPSSCALNVLRDLGSCRALLFDSGRNRGSCKHVDLCHGLGDLGNCHNGIASSPLWISVIWRGDFFRRLGRLGCQFLHLGSNNRKSLAGFTGARGLDGRVQREQVGLLGNCLDEGDNFTDFGCRFRKPFNLLVGDTRVPVVALIHDLRCLGDLAGNLANRGG